MKRRNIFIRLGLGLALVTAPLTALALTVPNLTSTASASPNAEFTTTNVTWTGGSPGNGSCLAPNSPGVDPVNCNIYGAKDDVWLNGGPNQAFGGTDGTYFFAVLDPGSQRSPNDDSAGLLSSGSYTTREFTVASGVIAPVTGNEYVFDSSNYKIQLLPFADTTNPGGVYIAAYCYLGPTGGTLVYPVDPSSCKYDMFKVSSTPTLNGEFNDPTAFKTATGSGTDTYTWSVVKSVDNQVIDTSSGATFNYTVIVSHDSGTPSDLSVSGMIDISNPNFNPDFSTSPLQLSGITDMLSDNTTCSVDTLGDLPDTSTLDLTAPDNFFPYTCTNLVGGYPTGELDNTVVASWDTQKLSNGATTTGSSVSYTTPSPGIVFPPTTVAGACVTVTDTLGGSLGTPCVSDGNNFTYTYAISFNSDPAGTCTTHPNTATATTNDTDISVSDGQSVKVCVGEDLQVSKTATPTFTRTYLWNISKSASATSITADGGGTASIGYTVKAGETGFKDSAWQVKGTITVTNPNDWESITPTGIGDVINNGGTCVVGALSPSTLGPKGSGTDVGTATYTCTYIVAPSPAAYTNTATVAWDSGTAFTPDGSNSYYLSGSFGAPTTLVNQNVTIVDTYAGTLGTLTATDTTPYPTTTYTYSRAVTIPAAFSCANVNNTATITQTGQSASATVKLCGTVAGALTMGFWQNNNGQAIIAGGASTAGVCNSATWLRLLAPFQDLGPSATCKQVATYVYNIVKLANAGGVTMNAMLKSQMLATSLDVYFSDPTLGGNKIAAPAALGSVLINLMNINNSGQNVSPAFNGLASITIMQMLTYAASKSSPGGTSWYSQVKATQGLAEVAFDDINNL